MTADPTTRLRDPLHLAAQARTDVGRERSHNEDHFLVDRDLRLFVVCDGMGGHRSGHVASETAVRVVREVVARRRGTLDAFEAADGGGKVEVDILALLEDAVQEANLRVFERGRQNASERGMGTTLSLLLVASNRGFIAHIGDTRVYRRRRGNLEALTEDHSLVNEMARSMNRPADTFDKRLRNAITRAVGVHEAVEVDALCVDLLPGDRFLLCSDGLHGLVAADELAALIDTPELGDGVEKMVARANELGGTDNITAVLVEVREPPTSEDAATRPRVVLLRACHLFRGLTTADSTRVAEACDVRTAPAGELLAAEGQRVDGLHVVASGRLDVARAGAPMLTLTRGDEVGAEALVTDSKSPASVRVAADGPAELLTLTRESFEALRHAAPAVALRVTGAVAAALARRIQALTPLLTDTAALFRAPAPLVPATRRAPRAAATTLTDVPPATGPVTGPRPRTGERQLPPTEPDAATDDDRGGKK